MKLFFGKLLCTLQQLRANSKSKWGRWVYDGGGLGLLASRYRVIGSFRVMHP